MDFTTKQSLGVMIAIVSGIIIFGVVVALSNLNSTKSTQKTEDMWNQIETIQPETQSILLY